MALAHSKITAQGRVSIPAAVRRKLGIRPGSVLAWEEEGDRIVVKKAGEYSFEDIHRALFLDAPPKKRTLAGLKDGVRRHIRKRHARS